MRTIAWVLLGALVGSLGGCAPPKSEPNDTVEVRGVVLDPLTDEAIAGVRVRARDVAGEVDITDAAGRFTLRLPPGEHHLWLDREGYLEGRHTGVFVTPGEPLEIEALLFPSSPREEDVARWLAERPPRRHEHPAHERPTPPRLEDDDLGRTILRMDGPPVLPETIRVWRSNGTPLQPTAGNGWADRSCDPAAVVLELPLEEYVRGVLPHEWIPSWDQEALRAGAIAARTYAVNWALRGGRWDCADVDDGTVTQVYRDGRSMPADEAIDATIGMVVVRNGSIFSTEYSAENSDPTEHGVAEPTCTGTARHGHGRGMCQWGTQRWARGECANPPCNFGSFGATPKDHLWMVEHYYPGATAVRAASSEPCEPLGPDGGIIEENDACFRAYGLAYWREVTGAGHGGRLLWTNAFESGSPSSWARWSIPVEGSATFRLEVYIDGEWGRYAQTRYRVTHAGGEEEIIVDQGAADGWVELGVFEFDGADGALVVEDNYTGSIAPDQHIVADAIRLSAPGMSPPDDGGVQRPDGGPAPPDGGMGSHVDGGLVDDDAGAVDIDGGPSTAVLTSGCAASGPTSSAPVLALSAALLSLAWRSRRRRFAKG